MQGVLYLLLLLWYESSTVNVLTWICLIQTLKIPTRVTSQEVYCDTHGLKKSYVIPIYKHSCQPSPNYIGLKYKSMYNIHLKKLLHMQCHCWVKVYLA